MKGESALSVLNRAIDVITLDLTLNSLRGYRFRNCS